MHPKMKDALKQALDEILAMDEETLLRELELVQGTELPHLYDYPTNSECTFIKDWLYKHVKLVDWPLNDGAVPILPLAGYYWDRQIGCNAQSVYFNGWVVANIDSVYGIEGLKYSGDYLGTR